MKSLFFKTLNYVSYFIALLSIYCKILVSKFNILSKSDVEILISFLGGIVWVSIMLFLLRYLSQKSR